ncbi:retrovirus-related Pol polyprotein from transposon 17.6 [Trichonephila clavipes]|nr:retrovirus-related Pol polyprotein from transposon 17.6 [Trichonephila clavipes]
MVKFQGRHISCPTFSKYHINGRTVEQSTDLTCIFPYTNPAVYLQVDDHVHPGNCPTAVSSEKKQDLLHMEFYHHLPSWAMSKQMLYFSSVSDEGSCDLKTTKEIPVQKYRNSVHVEVPNKSDGWDYFFSSLEKAFASEMVSDELKPKVLLCMLGDKVSNLLVNLGEEELKDYESLKQVVLKEGANDFESVNQLIVADKMFEMLDSETATHIGVLQGEEWYKPRDLGKQCDIFYASKGKSYDGPARAKWNDSKKRSFNGSWGKQPFGEKKTDKFSSRKNFDKGKVTEIKKFACFTCGSDEHFKRNCQKTKEVDNKRLNVNKVSTEGTELEDGTVTARVDLLGKVIPRRAIEDKLSKLVKTSISVDGKLVHALVDSGIFGPAVKCPLVYVPIGLATGGQVNVVHQQVLCALAEVLVEDVLLPPDVLDMLGGAQSEDNSLAQSSQDLRVDSGKVDETEVSSVGTLGTKDEEVTAEMDKGIMAADSFRSEQECCAELALVWKHAKEGKGNYYEVDGYLFHRDKILGESIGQLVIPKCRRTEVLRLAHTSVFSSHMGPKKTLERIKYSFFWEGLRANVKKFWVNMDLIGPIDPPSSKGRKYILCLVDQHTRWGEAVPLTSLSAKVTCEALLSIFSRTGIPNVVASDNGTNFVAELTKEFEKRIGSSPRFSTPGYPQSNGLVERFNRTLKNMLHNVAKDEGRGWLLQIPYVLWAYREIPHSTTGVSPFQLLYGRPPQGPLSILKSTWTGKHNNLRLCTTPVSKYLEDLKCKLEKAAEHTQAKLVSTVQQEKMAYYHNLRSSDRVFKVGEKVIVLIPDATSKLFARWQGPATIIEKRNPHSFLVAMPDNSTKHIHQNKLRHYVASSNSVNVIFEEEKEFGQVETPPTATEESKFYEVLNNLKTDNLNSYNLKVLKNLISKFKYIFTKPVQPARVGAHKIELVANAVRRKPHCYSVPMAYRREVERQVQELLDLNLIEPSEAEIAHPIVCVAKKDASIRMCVDFRALNAVTKVLVFPMKDMQELIFIAGSAHWLTSIDLLKGYWQIKMDEESKPLTAFTTHNAVYQWKTMPFALAGASGTFQREMNRILKSHSEYAQAYMDDVIFSKTFEEHLVHLELVLTELEKLGFSVRLDKCSFAAKRIKNFGSHNRGGTHGPNEDKILAIKGLIRPTTKKELKELLCEVISLATPDANLPFQVHCDASDYGVGCCLTQQDTEGIYRPIAFASQKFNATQKNWASIEKEAWAVLYGLNKFDKWIYGAKVEIISDHNPLKYLNQTTPKKSQANPLGTGVTEMESLHYSQARYTT